MNTTINGRAVETIEGRMAATDVAVAIAEDYAQLGYRSHGEARNAVQAAVEQMAADWSELQRVAAGAPGMALYGRSGGWWLTPHQVDQVRAQFVAGE